VLPLPGQATVEPLEVLFNPEVERRRQAELLPLPAPLSPTPTIALVGSPQASHSPAVALPQVHRVWKATPPLPVIALPDVPRVPTSTSPRERSPSHELLWCDPYVGEELTHSVVAGVKDAMTLALPQQVRVATPVQNTAARYCQPVSSGSSWKVQNGVVPIQNESGFRQEVAGSKQNAAVSKQNVSAPKQTASPEQNAALLKRIAAVQKQNAAVLEQNAAVSKRKAYKQTVSVPKQNTATSRQNVPAPNRVPSRQAKYIHPSPLRENYVAPEPTPTPTIRTPPASFVALQHSQIQGAWATVAPAQTQQIRGFLRYTGAPVGFVPVPAVQTEVRQQIALPRRASPPGSSSFNTPTSSVPVPVVAAQTQGFQGYLPPVTDNVGPVISLPVSRQEVQVTADPRQRASSWVQMLSEQNAAVSSHAASVPSSRKRRAPPVDNDGLPPSKKARVAKTMRTGVHATYRPPQSNAGTQACPIWVYVF
jgi:hypothetical protein